MYLQESGILSLGRKLLDKQVFDNAKSRALHNEIQYSPFDQLAIGPLKRALNLSFCA